MTHAVKDATSFFKANELEQVHVVVEAQVQVLFSAEHHQTERFDVIVLNQILQTSDSLLLLGAYLSKGVLSSIRIWSAVALTNA